MKARYFLILSVLAMVLAFVGLRLNIQHARELLATVTTADQAAGDTSATRTELQAYTQSHMGASVNFELTASYNRAVAAAQAAASGGQAQGGVYAAAQAACAGKADSIVQAHCVSSYVSTHTTPATQPQAPVLPSRTAYQYSYSSPLWSADLAGLALLAVALLLGTASLIWVIRLF